MSHECPLCKRDVLVPAPPPPPQGASAFVAAQVHAGEPAQFNMITIIMIMIMIMIIKMIMKMIIKIL